MPKETRSIQLNSFIHSFLFFIHSCRYATEAFRDGTLVGGDGSEREFLRKITDLRAEYFSIGDLCAGRMPIAYVQLLQILVDTLVWLAPLSLYSGLGSLSIPLCAILTHFFKGLLEMSKSFLDPFGNDGYPNQNIRYVSQYQTHSLTHSLVCVGVHFAEYIYVFIMHSDVQ